MADGIVIKGFTCEPSRDWKSIRIECTAGRDCVSGKIQGSPAAGMDRFVELLIREHAKVHEPARCRRCGRTSHGFACGPVA